MISLMATKNNEIIRATIDRSEDLETLEFLFPHNIIELDVVGNNLIAIIKEDTTNQL